MTVILSLLGGLVALDQTSLGQFMFARPLVSATLAGWLLGDPYAGLIAGALLEVLFLPAFPMGGATFPEGGPAGIVAATAAVAGAEGDPGAGLGLAVGLGTVWGLVGGWSITALRQLNERMAPVSRDGSVLPARVVVGHLSALGVDFMRGVLLTALGIFVVRLTAPAASSVWAADRGETALALGVTAALSLGGLLAGLDGLRDRWGLFVGGVLAGAAAGWLV